MTYGIGNQPLWSSPNLKIMNYFCFFTDTMKFRELVLLMMFVFVFFTNQSLVLSQNDSATGCVLDIHTSLSGNNSDCVAGNWGGFVEDSCCGQVFDDYLYALAKWANQTQRLFLNPTEQNNCLLLMQSSEKDVLGCGIKKLTSGAGGCSGYTIIDVLNNLGNKLKEFDEDCKLFGSSGRSDQACSSCLMRWEETVGSSDNGRNSTKAEEAEVCSFAVLVTLTSSRTGDKNWIQALYQCLGDQDISMGIKQCYISFFICFLCYCIYIFLCNTSFSCIFHHFQLKNLHCFIVTTAEQEFKAKNKKKKFSTGNFQTYNVHDHRHCLFCVLKNCILIEIL